MSMLVPSRVDRVNLVKRLGARRAARRLLFSTGSQCVNCLDGWERETILVF